VTAETSPELLTHEIIRAFRFSTSVKAVQSFGESFWLFPEIVVRTDGFKE
jgi:hypothetical protein